MKKILFILLFSFSITSQSFAQETEIQKNIKELLELTGSAKLGIQVGNQLIDNFKKAFPDVDNEFWDEFMKEINPEDLIGLIIPIYEKYYTLEEVKQLITFYKTPIGKKTIELMPSITQDSMKAGQEWGREIGEKVVKKLEEK